MYMCTWQICGGILGKGLEVTRLPHGDAVARGKEIVAGI
jgi:hypothetical protein